MGSGQVVPSAALCPGASVSVALILQWGQPWGPVRHLCARGSRVGGEKADRTEAEEKLCAALLPLLCCGWDRGGSCKRTGGSAVHHATPWAVAVRGFAG